MEQNEIPTCSETNDNNSSQDRVQETPPNAETEVDEIIMELQEEEGEIVEDSPVFEVVFRKEFEFRKYSETIVELFKQHLTVFPNPLDFSTKIETNDDGSFTGNIQAFETTANIKSNENENETQIKTEKVKEKEKEEDHDVIVCDDSEDCDQISNDSQDFGVELNNLFTIDPMPSTSLEYSAVPSYKRAVKEFLDDKIEQKAKKPENFCPRPKPNSTCFNCGATNHGLRDCTLPRSAKRINRAKKARSNRGERYHVDVDQRFAHLRPGVISEKLQKALRLRNGELPSFFYRMRICGYPPGWLEDAKVSDSGLAMFNTGDDVLKSEEGSEELKDDIKFDISKIIEFPGFNVSPGSGFYDDYKHYNVPPLSRKHMREEMITALGDRAIKGYKRRKVKDDNATTDESNIIMERKMRIEETHDMDIEDAEAVQIESVQFTRPMPPPLPYSEEIVNPPLPLDCDSPSPPPFKPTSPTPLCSDNDTTERSESPTLAELQERQRALLLKLECGDELPNDDDDNDNNDDDDDISLEISNCISIPTENIDVIIPTTTIIEPATPTTPITPITSDAELKKIIKSSHMGTPVLQFSPFEKLPAGENFKVGVSDVINFENLPDSTGKYESMKDVIKKVRNVKKQLNAEDD